MYGPQVQLDVVEERATAVEEQATTVTMIMEAMKEAANSVKVVQSLGQFEEEVQEAVCNVFMKGFDECKKKIAQLFHLPDLHDVVPVNLKDNRVGTMPPAKATPMLPAPQCRWNPLSLSLQLCPQWPRLL